MKRGGGGRGGGGWRGRWLTPGERLFGGPAHGGGGSRTEGRGLGGGRDGIMMQQREKHIKVHNHQ